MRLEHRPRRAAVPGAGNTAIRAIGMQQVVRCKRAARTNFVEHGGHKLRVLGYEFLESPGANAMDLPAVAEQGPRGHGNDRGFMSPLLGIPALAINQVVEDGSIVRAQTREKHLVLRGYEDVDVVDLHEAELPDGALDISRGDGTAGTRTIETLGRQRDAPRLTQRKSVVVHRGRVSAGSCRRRFHKRTDMLRPEV